MSTLNPTTWRALRLWGLLFTSLDDSLRIWLRDYVPSDMDAGDWYGLRAEQRCAPLAPQPRVHLTNTTLNGRHS